VPRTLQHRASRWREGGKGGRAGEGRGGVTLWGGGARKEDRSINKSLLAGASRSLRRSITAQACVTRARRRGARVEVEVEVDECPFLSICSAPRESVGRCESVLNFLALLVQKYKY
jgi:hypothetical protein